MPEESFYKDYSTQIMHAIYSSQNARYGSMPTMEFATQVVEKVLRKDPPRYITLGGSVTLWYLLKWLPRPWVLRYMWNKLSTVV